MAAKTRNKKTASESRTIAKGKKNPRTPEFKRIVEASAEKAGDVTRMGTGRGEVISQVRESGAERMAREKADEGRAARRERVDRWVQQIKDKKSKMSDVPDDLKPYVRDAMKPGPAPLEKKAAKKAAPKKADGVKSPADIKAEMDKKAKSPKAPKSTTRPIERAVSDATAKRAADAMKKDPWNKRPAPAAQESPKAAAKPKKSATAPSAKAEKPKSEPKPKTTAPAAEKKAKPKFEQKPKAAAKPKAEPKPKAPRATAPKAPTMSPAIKKATDAIKIANKFKGPLAGLAGAARVATNPYAAAATIAAPYVLGGLKRIGEGMQEQAKKGSPTSSVTKAETALGKRLGNKTGGNKPAAKSSPVTARADQGRDRGASAAANIVRGTVTKPKATSSVTVAKGDTLWGIAKANNTSVDALLKANPVLAQRKAAGKTVLFSNTKVRIPKKK